MSLRDTRARSPLAIAIGEELSYAVARLDDLEQAGRRVTHELLGECREWLLVRAEERDWHPMIDAAARSIGARWAREMRCRVEELRRSFGRPAEGAPLAHWLNVALRRNWDVVSLRIEAILDPILRWWEDEVEIAWLQAAGWSESDARTAVIQSEVRDRWFAPERPWEEMRWLMQHAGWSANEFCQAYLAGADHH